MIGLKLNPNYATGYHWYAELLLFQGRKGEAIEAIALAVELDPVSMAILKDQGIVYYYCRQYDLGVEKALTALELDPEFIPAHRLLALCYTQQGGYDEAIRENDLWGELIRNKTKADLGRAHILAWAGRAEEAKTTLEGITPERLGGNDARSMAIVYAALKELDPAFFWLYKSLEIHEESLCSLVVDPKMDPLREDPRFDEVVRQLGLPVQHPLE